jgi:hypothetical protein
MTLIVGIGWIFTMIGWGIDNRMKNNQLRRSNRRVELAEHSCQIQKRELELKKFNNEKEDIKRLIDSFSNISKNVDIKENYQTIFSMCSRMSPEIQMLLGPVAQEYRNVYIYGKNNHELLVICIQVEYDLNRVYSDQSYEHIRPILTSEKLIGVKKMVAEQLRPLIESESFKHKILIDGIKCSKNK